MPNRRPLQARGAGSWFEGRLHPAVCTLPLPLPQRGRGGRSSPKQQSAELSAPRDPHSCPPGLALPQFAPARHATSAFFLLLLLLASATPARAEAAPDRAVLDRLGAADHAARATATADLLADPSLSDRRIDGLYAAASTPEQRHRLLRIARHHLLRRLREAHFEPVGDGSLGIRQSALLSRQLPQIRAPAIAVVSTLPGMPAHEKLRRGDLILAVGGQPLRDDHRGNTLNTSFVALVKRKRPGQPLHLRVLRDGGTIEVEVVLASRRALDGMYREMNVPVAGAAIPPEPVLAEPFRSRWQQRRDQLLATGPPVTPIVVVAEGTADAAAAP